MFEGPRSIMWLGPFFMERRNFLRMLLGGMAGMTMLSEQAEAFHFGQAKRAKTRHAKKVKTKLRRPVYQGRTEVSFNSKEKPGTLIIKTNERALYKVLGNGKALRYLVAVGKEGFSWAGVAKVGMKRENPIWTPPPEMIDRKPEYAKWAEGMPGGLPINPLGPRAMYLFDKSGDTGFRIHGTIHPESIGTAASSGCIRMLNKEVIELYEQTRVGTKVIVI
jgi:lipoprotein-anchoring transpeptidase ErfK/SrfK